MTPGEIANIVLTLIWIIITISGLKIAYDQLKVASDQLRKMAQSADSAQKANVISTLNSMLLMEGIMGDRRVLVKEAALECAKLAVREKNGEDLSQEEYALADFRLQEAKENYLNAIDRLCASFLRDLVPEETYRTDYKQFIIDLVRNSEFKDSFGPGTPFRNIVHLYERWVDQ